MPIDWPDVIGGSRFGVTLRPLGGSDRRVEDTSPQGTPSTVSPSPVTVSEQIITLEEFIRMMGDRFEQKNPNDFKRFAGEDGKLNWEDLDKDKDGKITRSELQALIDARVIDEELFNLLANAGVVRQGSDGEISKEDLEKALSVINKYAQWKGISSEEAAKIYLDPATTFQNANLDALLEAKQSIQEAVGGLNFSDIKSENSLKNALVSLNYRQEIIDQVVALITDYQNLTVDFVVRCIINVIDKARIEGKIDSNSITKASILGWLRGGMGIEEQVNDQSITEDPRFKKIFLWDYRMDRVSVAVDYLKQLIEAGKLATAKRALELIQARVQERGNMPELLNLENHNGLMYLFAMGYAKKAKESGSSEYLRASFDVAQRLTERRDEVLSNILNICLENVGAYYDLALEVAGKLPNKEINYARVAAECLRNPNQEIRGRAVEILEEIPSNYSFTGQEAQAVLGIFSSLGINIPRTLEGGYQAMPNSALLSQVKLAVLVDPKVWERQYTLIKLDPHAAPFDRISLAAGATQESVLASVAELDRIIASNGTNAYNRAYAHYVKAMLLYGLAKSQTNPEAKITFAVNGQNVSIKAKDLLREVMYELRTAWEKCKRDDGDYQSAPEYLELMRNIFGRMVDIVDGTINSNVWGNANDSKKLGKELVRFIPNYDSPSVTYIAYSTSQNSANRPRNPAQYRRAIDGSIGSKDGYLTFQSQLNGSGSNQNAQTTASSQGRRRRTTSSGNTRTQTSSPPPQDPNQVVDQINCFMGGGTWMNGECKKKK